MDGFKYKFVRQVHDYFHRYSESRNWVVRQKYKCSCVGGLFTMPGNTEVARLGHFIFVILTIWSVPITTVRWSTRGKFVHGSLADMSFMAYHASRYINTILCACQLLVQRERFSFSHLWSARYHWFVMFSMATTKCAVVARPWHTFGMLFCLGSGTCSL